VCQNVSCEWGLNLSKYLYEIDNRKFYVSEEEEEVDQKCHDMLTVILFVLDLEILINWYCFNVIGTLSIIGIMGSKTCS